MSEQSDRQSPGAATTDESDNPTSPVESESQQFVDDDSPPEEHLSPEKVELVRATVEDYRSGKDGHVAIRPIWEQCNPQVAQIRVSVGGLDIVSSLGGEEVDTLITELQHAKEIAAEYSEDES